MYSFHHIITVTIEENSLQFTNHFRSWEENGKYRSCMFDLNCIIYR